MTALVSLLFIAMIAIDYNKSYNFLLLHVCLFTFFGNNYNIGEFISATSKERMTTNIIFAGTTPTRSYASKLRIRVCLPRYTALWKEKSVKLFSCH